MNPHSFKPSNFITYDKTHIEVSFCFLVYKIIWYFCQAETETWQYGLYVCLEPRQVAGILILCNHLIIYIPYLNNRDRTFQKQSAFRILFCFYSTIKISISYKGFDLENVLEMNELHVNFFVTFLIFVFNKVD